MYLNDLFALLQGQFFILKFLLSLINILNIKQRVSMPSFYAFIACVFIERPLEDVYFRSRTDFQLRFKKNKLLRINLNKWTLISYLNR